VVLAAIAVQAGLVVLVEHFELVGLAVDWVHTAKIGLIDFAERYFVAVELAHYFEVVAVGSGCLGFAVIAIFEAMTVVECLAVPECFVDIALAIESFDFVVAIVIGSLEYLSVGCSN